MDKINLLVGDSGSGKTRLINTLTHLFQLASSEKIKFAGKWDIVFSLKNKKYQWKIELNQKSNNKEAQVINEELLLIESDSKSIILKRENDRFLFKDKEYPVLPLVFTSFSLLQNDAEIFEIIKGFRSIISRKFFSNELERNFTPNILQNEILNDLIQKKDLLESNQDFLGYNNRIFLLYTNYQDKYNALIEFYKSVYPFIIEFRFKDKQIGKEGNDHVKNDNKDTFIAKILQFKEKNIGRWIDVTDIASGMQKVFLLALDIFMSPDEQVLIIDEFENSLGINSINSIPELLKSLDFNLQYIISSHHPYMINTIPIDNWLVFHRNGLNVTIKSGQEFKLKYSKSMQQQFVQLINDPFFIEGNE